VVMPATCLSAPLTKADSLTDLCESMTSYAHMLYFKVAVVFERVRAPLAAPRLRADKGRLTLF
jgi:hypothetical protein